MGLVWLHNICDALIWLAYFAIPVVLVHFTRRRKDLPFSWMFWLFALFIVGCGTTHLMEVVTSYIPLYRLSGLVKLVTAVASVATAVLLVPLVPRALALRSPQDLQREIEEHKKTQRELQAQAKVLREQTQLLDLAHDSIFVRDLDGRISFWNQGAAERYGWSREEARGQVSHTLLHTEFPAPLADIRAQLLRDGRWEGELTHTRRDGSRIVVASRWALRRDEGGNPVGVLEINNDITERKKVEAALEQRTAQLQETNGALEAFGYSVSHDLRTPLRNMKSLAQALEEDYGNRLEPSGRDFLRRITAAARKMDTLVNDLLAYSRLSRADLPLGPLDLGGVLAESQAAVADAIRERQAEVLVEGPLPQVFGHRTTLVQAVTNLLANALKFVARDVLPKIRVRAEDRGALVRLWVEDNGIGIAPDHQQRIFKVFERLHGEESYPGTGIGLAIVKKGVERTGGRAGVESEVGRGSRFWVDLPKPGEPR